MADLVNCRMLLKVIVSSLLLVSSFTVTANQCLNFISSNAVAVNQLKICESSYTGISDTYSCQDYQSGETQYRVLYKGGISPKAITTINDQQQEKLIWSRIYGDQQLNCPLVAPRGIHIHATHRGTGICSNEKNQSVPCSIYEHKASRQLKSHRYLVFYPVADSATTAVEVKTFIFDATEDAMSAEIAYQIGLSLLDTQCCSQQAMLYLEYAYQLYPKANKYSKAYHNARFNLSLNE